MYRETARFRFPHVRWNQLFRSAIGPRRCTYILDFRYQDRSNLYADDRWCPVPAMCSIRLSRLDPLLPCATVPRRGMRNSDWCCCCHDSLFAADHWNPLLLTCPHPRLRGYLWSLSATLLRCDRRISGSRSPAFREYYDSSLYAACSANP